MRVLLLSAYHSASHAYWCDGLMAAFPEIHWTLKTQPARHFSWRVEASGLLWGLSDDADFERHYDLIIATSLSDLARLRAFRPHLAAIPTWLYFHENQFAHPRSESQSTDHQIGWQFLSIQNALCADWISFNTEFNRSTFLAGARQLLRRFPEKLPGKPLNRMEQHSDVLPVPLTDRMSDLATTSKEADLIVWNHRWEWDKQPERFLAALVRLRVAGIGFRLAMLGSGGGRQGDYDRERQALGDAVVYWGEASPEDYRQWMGRAGIGVSTAIHDFQGLAMLEMAQTGARVIVPRRLAYPECLPNALFYTGSEQDAGRDIDDLTELLCAVLAGDKREQGGTHPLPRWSSLVFGYADRMETIASGSYRRPQRVSGR
jgi:glycosyltransferase involved in cell wall biosynthesis